MRDGPGERDFGNAVDITYQPAFPLLPAPPTLALGLVGGSKNEVLLLTK